MAWLHISSARADHVESPILFTDSLDANPNA
jgi:hypothetical protein